MKTIGIKLADGSFFPVMEEGSAQTKKLQLTTAHNDQTRVMVDLYRSATGSMDDAEYIDTLQIENLNKHPNGELDLSFQISLDENNELTANIIDPETGAESDSEISLINRTVEERLTTDDYTLSEAKLATVDDFQDPDSIGMPEEAPLDTLGADESLGAADLGAASLGGAAAGALGAAALDSLSDIDDLGSPETLASDDTLGAIGDLGGDDGSFDTTDLTAMDGVEDIAGADDDSLGLADLGDIDIPTDTAATDETLASDDLVAVDNLGGTDDFASANSLGADTLAATDDFGTTEDLTAGDDSLGLADLGDIDIPTDTAATDETLAGDENIFETTEATAETDDLGAVDNLGGTDDFGSADALSTDETITGMDDFGSADALGTDETITGMDDFASADTLSADETITGMDDFGSADALSTDETISETDDFAAPDSLGAGDLSATESISDDQNIFDTPVDNAMAPADDFAGADALADMSAFDEPAATNDLGSTDGLVADDSFAAPDQEALTGADINFEDSGSAQDSEPVAAGNALSFTGLYDKETEMGESASHEDGETKKKIKIPMFVCIGCAAICILVTILLLIFLPTKYELKSNVTVTETSAGPEAIAAKENEIIIIKDGDKVTPVNNIVNRKGVSYKIKWGDTLWDIADTYYNNPWKYKKIASYNGIKNPDHIISGTVITIPAE